MAVNFNSIQVKSYIAIVLLFRKIQQTNVQFNERTNKQIKK